MLIFYKTSINSNCKNGLFVVFSHLNIIYEPSMKKTSHKAHLIAKLSSMVALLVLLGTGCNRIPNGNFAEGRISYRIVYDSLTNTAIPHKLLPSDISVRFKDNNTFTQIGGMMSMGLIRKYNEQLFTSLVNIKFTGLRLKYTETFDVKTPAFYANVPAITISEQREDIQMFGLNCKRATGYYQAAMLHPFEIIYTNDIDIAEPNAHSPFAEIDGVMLAFTLYMPPFMMHVKAIDVRSERVDDNLFEAPNNYSEVDAQAIADLLQSVMR